jgi:hypothetical protein
MSNLKRFILITTNVLMLVAGLYGVLGYFSLTRQRLAHGYSGYASADEIMGTTEVIPLQSKGAFASSNWRVCTDFIDWSRWYCLTSGVVLFVGGVVHFTLTAWGVRSKA